MIRPYLSDIINDHKSSNKLRDHSRNKVIDYETQYGEWKIQVIMSIFFFYLGFPSRTFTSHRTAGERGEYIFNFSFTTSIRFTGT